MNAPAYNTVAWFQVGTTDAEQARGFYGDLFGWRYTLDPNSEGKYHLVSYPGADTPSGGIFDTGGEFPNHAIFMVVVQDVATKTGLGSLLGAVHVNILRALGCVGAVTNGAVRDLPAAEALGFQLFAGSVSVSHAYVHIVEFGTPVEIGGLKIQSGDLLHGDLHGIQSVPPDLAAKLPAAAAAIAARERKLITLCQSPDFSLERLRTVVRQLG